MKSFTYLLIASSLLLFSTTVLAYPQQGDNDVFKVVLDAGHGGHDPGNLGNGYMEKNIALNIVLQIGEHLKKYDDIEVIYTRKDDSFVDLYVRGEIANKANADLFVSVHCDSHSSNAHGAHTFVLGLHANEQNFEIAKKENSVIYLEDNYESRYAEYNINSPESVIGLTIMQEEFLEQSIELAKLVQQNFAKKLKRRDRQVKQAGFIVLHQTFMPSILIETGFLTNKEEGRYLNSKNGQSQMGKAIADAIVSYKDNVRADDSLSFLPLESEPEEYDEPVEQPTSTPSEQIKPVVEQQSPPVSTSDSDPGTNTKEVKSNPEELKTSQEVNIPAETEEISSTTTSEQVTTSADIPDKKEPEVVEVVKKEKSSEAPQTSVAKPKSNIIFKVQIMASSKNLPLEPRNFKGLNVISKEPYKNLYRYMYGETDDFQQAKILKSGADAKGFTTSFIVAYENGVRIPVKEARAKL